METNDLLINVNADQLVKTEIKNAIEKELNAHSLAIVNSTKAVGTKKKTQRNKVKASITKMSEDGKSLAGLYEIELAMNDLKVDGLINDMKSLKACIEWVFNDLVKDKEYPFFVKENRQSMKNVTILDNFPCVMSDTLPPKKRKKDVNSTSADDIEVIVNLTEDDNNSFESKNKILFQKMTDLDEKNELVVNDEEFDYNFITLVAKLRKELRTKRLEKVESAEEVEEVAA